MRNFTILSVLLVMWSSLVFAQQRSTVQATSQEISDNLDLRAVASVFAESRNLEVFEQKLNDPKLMISNLDLNNDGYVDYLRVVEMKENRNHLVVIQSVLAQDVYQDVATIDVQRNAANRATQVHIIGDPYLYGQNYVYQPVFAHTPLIYDYFWMPTHVVYVSPWRWNRYPRFYSPWRMYPMFRYRNHIHAWASMHYFYYMNTPWNHGFYNAYFYGPRMNHWEVRHPQRAFNIRNAPHNVANSYELAQNTGVGNYSNIREHTTNTPLRRETNLVNEAANASIPRNMVNNNPTRANVTNDVPVRSTNVPVRNSGPNDAGWNAEMNSNVGSNSTVIPRTDAVRTNTPTRANSTAPTRTTVPTSATTPPRTSTPQRATVPSRTSAPITRSAPTRATVPSRATAPARTSTPSRSAVQSAPTRSSAPAASAPTRSSNRNSGVSAPSRSSSPSMSAPARSASPSSRSGAIRR